MLIIIYTDLFIDLCWPCTASYIGACVWYNWPKKSFLYNINNTTTKLTHSCQSSATRDLKSPVATQRKPLKQNKNVASNSLSED